MRVYKGSVATILALFLALPIVAQDAGHKAVIWSDRGDATTMDLAGGAGGKSREPGVSFKFIKESEGGTAPKFIVEDENGVMWKIKLGPEAQSETAATRLLWAAGYFVDENYYRSKITVQGLTKLARGQEFVSNGNTVSGARLERQIKGEESTPWSWYENVFVGTREFNGLRVMMALLNNWDLKEINNGSSITLGGSGEYQIMDLGATLGNTGNNFNRSKGIAKDYAETRFIEKITPTYVDFVMHSRPFFLGVVNLPNYRGRTRMESVVKRIPLDDARWIGDRLGQFSTAQISDCFRAAGFSTADVEVYTRTVKERIAELKKL
jgi:hypothetical protein